MLNRRAFAVAVQGRAARLRHTQNFLYIEPQACIRTRRQSDKKQLLRSACHEDAGLHSLRWRTNTLAVVKVDRALRRTLRKLK